MSSLAGDAALDLFAYKGIAWSMTGLLGLLQCKCMMPQTFFPVPK